MITLDNIKGRLRDERIISLSPVYTGIPDSRAWIKRLLQPERKYFLLNKAITAQLSNGDVVTIEEGFRTDLSSSPQLLWGVEPPYGDFLFAALLHDWLYVNTHISQEFADKEMLLWSNAIYWNKKDNLRRYKAVRKFGGPWWESCVRKKFFENIGRLN